MKSAMIKICLEHREAWWFGANRRVDGCGGSFTSGRQRLHQYSARQKAAYMDPEAVQFVRPGLVDQD